MGKERKYRMKIGDLSQGMWPDWQAILADFNEYIEDDDTWRPKCKK